MTTSASCCCAAATEERSALLYQQIDHRWPVPAGWTARAHTLPLDTDLLRGAERLLDDLGWIGLVELEFIRGADGGPRLIDFNGRYYGSMQLAVAAGMDFPRLWAEDATGHNPEPSPAARVGVRFQRIGGDLRRALKERRGGRVLATYSTRWPTESALITASRACATRDRVSSICATWCASSERAERQPSALGRGSGADSSFAARSIFRLRLPLAPPCDFGTASRAAALSRCGSLAGGATRCVVGDRMRSALDLPRGPRDLVAVGAAPHVGARRDPGNRRDPDLATTRAY